MTPTPAEIAQLVEMLREEPRPLHSAAADALTALSSQVQQLTAKRTVAPARCGVVYHGDVCKLPGGHSGWHLADKVGHTCGVTVSWPKQGIQDR